MKQWMELSKFDRVRVVLMGMAAAIMIGGAAYWYDNNLLKMVIIAAIFVILAVTDIVLIIRGSRWASMSWLYRRERDKEGLGL